MRGISHRCDAHLVFGGRRAAGGADFGVRPRLRGNPAERVVAVSARRAKNVVLAFGKEVAALVLNHIRSEEHTSELQSLTNLVCRLLLEKKKMQKDRSSRE